jgi:hypothetical protein
MVISLHGYLRKRDATENIDRGASIIVSVTGTLPEEN